MREFVERFDGIEQTFNTSAPIRVARGWLPGWSNQQIDNGISKYITPQYFVTNQVTYNGWPTQAVVGDHGLINAGIVQGPFVFPKGTELTLDIWVNCSTYTDVNFKGCIWAYIGHEVPIGKIGWTPYRFSGRTKIIRDVWMKLNTSLSVGSKPVYVGGWISIDNANHPFYAHFGQARLSINGKYDTIYVEKGEVRNVINTLSRLVGERR